MTNKIFSRKSLLPLVAGVLIGATVGGVGIVVAETPVYERKFFNWVDHKSYGTKPVLQVLQVPLVPLAQQAQQAQKETRV